MLLAAPDPQRAGDGHQLSHRDAGSLGRLERSQQGAWKPSTYPFFVQVHKAQLMEQTQITK